MEETLRALLAGDSAVAALFGARISWSSRVQGGGLPALTMHLVGGGRDHHMAGYSNPVPYRVQINIYAASYWLAVQAGRTVAALLDGYGSGSLQAVFLEGERELSSSTSNDPETSFGIAQDYLIHFTA